VILRGSEASTLCGALRTPASSFALARRQPLCGIWAVLPFDAVALGYEEGKHIVIEYRWAEARYDRLPELAAELVKLNVDVIVTQSTPGSRAATLLGSLTHQSATEPRPNPCQRTIIEFTAPR
jgi:hypothetical protein